MHAYSYYYGDGSWYFDDEMTKAVVLAEAPESEFASIEIVSYESNCLKSQEHGPSS
ncbi:hypothetical protein ES702_02393 [subsurface metagenome]